MAKSYVTAQIESDLHDQLSIEAQRNKISFTKQIRSYVDRCIVLEGENQELRTEIQKLKKDICLLRDEIYRSTENITREN